LNSDGSKIIEILNADQMRKLIGKGEFAVSFLCTPSQSGKYCIIMAQSTVTFADRAFWVGYHPGLGRFDFLIRTTTGQIQVQGANNVDPNGYNLVIVSAGDGEARLLTIPLSMPEFHGRVMRLPLSAPMRNAKVPFTLCGRFGESAENRFKGAVDEVVFYDKSLNIKQMAAIFEHYRSGKRIKSGFDLAKATNQTNFQAIEFPTFALGKREIFRAKPMRLKSGESYVAPRQIAGGDFLVDIELAVHDVSQSVFQIDLGADGFLFDGSHSVPKAEWAAPTTTPPDFI
jgi:hypothetical protein